MKDKGLPYASHLSLERLIQILNQDLASDCHAMIAFLVYSNVLQRAACPATAQALESHAAQDYQHAKTLADQIIFLGGKPCLIPEPGEMTHLMLSV